MSSLTQNFVSAQLCVDLYTAGLKIEKPTYFFKVKNNVGLLNSFAFDFDNVYEQIEAALAYTDSGVEYYPAFQLCDMQAMMPDFFLSKDNNVFNLNGGSIFGYKVISGPRLPDVFAKMILHGLEIGTVSSKNAVLFLNSKK